MFRQKVRLHVRQMWQGDQNPITNGEGMSLTKERLSDTITLVIP